MNAFVKSVLLLVTAFGVGVGVTVVVLPSVSSSGNDTVAKVDTAAEKDKKEPLYWVAPMDPNYQRDKPGKSPMGMDLVPFYGDADAVDDKPGTVKISPLVENNLGVKVRPVKRGALNLTVATVGYVSFDEETLTHFHSRVDGWVEHLSVTSQGDPVEKGQKLFELYSPELVNAQEEYLAALRSNNERLIAASENKLEALGISTKQIHQLKQRRKVNQRLSFYADQDGYIATLSVREGSFIKPATKVLSVGSLNTVWVIAEIFERQASWVKAGQTVEMTTDSFPNQRWIGVVDYIYPVLENKTRTLQARIKFDNSDEKLKPNMFARLDIHTEQVDNALIIPREAIIRSAKMNRVVRALGGGKFRSARIETGIEVGAQVQVLTGLMEGENVVVSAQFLIDSESSISAELSRIEGDDSEEPDSVWIEGVIINLMSDHAMASIEHEPVKAWNWPGMTMDFNFAKTIDLNRLRNGQSIRFKTEKTKNHQYRITEVESASEKHSIDHSKMHNH